MGSQDVLVFPGGGFSNPAPFAPTAQTGFLTPGSGINFGATLYAGDPLPSWMDAAGQFWSAQTALWQGHFTMFHPADAGNWGTFGERFQTIGASQAVNAQASTNIYTQTLLQRSTSAAAINSSAGLSGNVGTTVAYYRGAAAGRGGFFGCWVFSTPVLLTGANGTRVFVGLNSGSPFGGGGATDPSATITHKVGIGKDSSDAAYTLYTDNGSGAATKATLGGSMPAPVNADSTPFLVRLFLYAKPNDSLIFYRVDDLIAGAIVADTSTSTTLPTNTTFMAPVSQSNTGGTSAVAVVMGNSRIYVACNNY